MRRLLGELLLYYATLIEALAIRVGDEYTAAHYLEQHVDPTER